MVLGSRPSILGSKPDNDLGSNPAALSRLGSIPANILGSRPRAAAALLRVVDDGVEVLGATEEGCDVLGDLLSSLLALALEGGLGEALGELELLDVGGVVVDDVLAMEVPRNMSIPGMPAIIAGLRP